MKNSNYDLRYLPLFFDDLNETVLYIANELHNPDAAMRVLNKVEKAILDRLPVAESFEQYHSIRKTEQPYYRIYIDNFVVFYVVLDGEDGRKIMEVRRFLYVHRNTIEMV